MKHWKFILIFLFGFFSCQDVKAPEKPKDLITENKMIDILTEAYLANAARSVDNKSIIGKGIVIDTIVYKNFGVDSLQFAKSNAYYAADVNKYIELFQKVEIRLNVLQSNLDSIQQIEKRKRDSIKDKIVDDQHKAEHLIDSLI